MLQKLFQYYQSVCFDVQVLMGTGFLSYFRTSDYSRLQLVNLDNGLQERGEAHGDSR